MAFRVNLGVDMKETGKLTISRPSSNTNIDGWIRIEVRNNENNNRLIVDVDLKEFAQAITGLGRVNCELITFDDVKTRTAHFRKI